MPTGRHPTPWKWGAWAESGPGRAAIFRGTQFPGATSAQNEPICDRAPVVITSGDSRRNRFRPTREPHDVDPSRTRRARPRPTQGLLAAPAAVVHLLHAGL